MKRIRLAATLLVLLLLASMGPWHEAYAQEENRAGLVVVHGDGTVVEHCVAFAEESISGYELLQRAGLALSVEAGATGATLCSIDGEGCSYPAEACFCQCQGSPCVYWSYWRMTEEGWFYQVLGAGNARVKDGDVEGWHWAAGTTRNAEAPPPVTFAELCPNPAPAEEMTIAVAPLPAEGVAASVAATVPVTAGVAGELIAVPAATVNLGVALLLGVVMVPGLLLVAFALRRRGGSGQ